MRNRTAWIIACQIMIGSSLAAEEAAKPAAKSSDAADIKLAMSAGPSDISKNATITTMSADHQMKTLRKGTNGWMCMARPEAMCLDKEWQGWADGWINKKDPQVKNVGVAYMLQGDKGASNTDPYAEKQAADNHWVVSGPHVMMLTPDAAQLDALPTDPNNGGPWVMWKGTKYAHIMVPTAPMPKTPPIKSSAPKPAEKK
jgi:hypothetical protein